jgi:hypothetical protein
MDKDLFLTPILLNAFYDLLTHRTKLPVKILRNIKKLETENPTATAQQPLPIELRDDLTRTRVIVACMEQFLQTPEKFRGLTIRHQAAFSSLSNPDFHDTGKQETYKWLEKERELLIQMIKGGAKLKVILRPPLEPPLYDEMWLGRYEKLLQFLRTESDIRPKCEFVIEPTRAPNLFLFGNEVLFESYATRPRGGYDATINHTESDIIDIRIRIFDELFKVARGNTIEKFGAVGASPQNSKAVRQAVIRGIEEAKKNLLIRKNQEMQPNSRNTRWRKAIAKFHDAFANTPEEEVERDLMEALAEVRREKS